MGCRNRHCRIYLAAMEIKVLTYTVIPKRCTSGLFCDSITEQSLSVRENSQKISVRKVGCEKHIGKVKSPMIHKFGIFLPARVCCTLISYTRRYVEHSFSLNSTLYRVSSFKFSACFNNYKKS